MSVLKIIFPKSFVWVIFAFIISFPLALIPLVMIDQMVFQYGVVGFMSAIDGRVMPLYLLSVVMCFVGLFLSVIVYFFTKYILVYKK